VLESDLQGRLPPSALGVVDAIRLPLETGQETPDERRELGDERVTQVLSLVPR
jgi:hypothetical protein